MSGRFDGKVALVTGAGSGIGRAVAQQFACDGASVMAADIDASRATKTAGIIEAQGGIARGMQCDVGDEQSVQALLSETTARFGAIDFGINNAGVTHAPAPTGDLRLSDWERCMRVNVIGVWLCMREELKHMTARKRGVIVNTASFAGYHSLKDQSAYVASKHAVMGLTRNAAIEYGGEGIRVNGVCPGGLPTTMFEENLQGLDSAARAETVRAVEAFHPMQRLAEPTEIADAILFLCSDQASFITGAMLPVDGGWGAI